MTTSEIGARRFPIEDQDLINAATAFEVDRRSDIASVPAIKLDAAMRLAGQRALKDATVCRLLNIDEGQLYQFWISPSYELTQEQEEIINELYAVGAAAWHESNGDLKKARARLNKKSHRLIKDPSNPSCSERSILEAIADGDIKQVISVMDYLLGDFNPEVISRDS
jgi:hypothetical protein